MSVKALRALLLAANLLAAAAGVAAGAYAFLAFLKQEPPRRSAAPAAGAQQVRMPQGGLPVSHYAPIWRLRAIPSDNQAPAAAPAPEQPRGIEWAKQILKGLLEVHGTICNRTRPGESYAILNVRRENRTETVKPGETIQEAKVEEIRRDEVVFSYKGISGIGLEIALPAGAPNTRQMGGRPGAPAPGAIGSAAGPSDSVRAAPATAFTSRPVGPNHWEIDKSEIQFIQGNQTKMIDELRPVPRNDESGKQVGVELQNVPADSLAAQRGLQKGDVIKAVNGINVDSMDFAQIGKKIGNARTVTLTVERKGRLVTMTYSLR